MGKKDGTANPMTSFYRKRKQEERERTRVGRERDRARFMEQRTPAELWRDIRHVQRLEHMGQATPQDLARKKQLLEAHFKVSQRLELARKRQHDAAPVRGLGKIVGHASKSLPSQSNSSFDTQGAPAAPSHVPAVASSSSHEVVRTAPPPVAPSILSTSLSMPQPIPYACMVPPPPNLRQVPRTAPPNLRVVVAPPPKAGLPPATTREHMESVGPPPNKRVKTDRSGDIDDFMAQLQEDGLL